MLIMSATVCQSTSHMLPGLTLTTDGSNGWPLNGEPSTSHAWRSMSWTFCTTYIHYYYNNNNSNSNTTRSFETRPDSKPSYFPLLKSLTNNWHLQLKHVWTLLGAPAALWNQINCFNVIMTQKLGSGHSDHQCMQSGTVKQSCNKGKPKLKAYNTCIAPQAAYSSCMSQKPATTDWSTTNQPYATLVCRLMVSALIIHVITWITTHLPTPKGWMAELAWLVDP